VALDFPAFGQALWKVSDELGIRPEWQLPVLSLESGFNPSIVNPYGCVGLNQFCPGTFEHYVPVSVGEYRQWPASEQLAGPILAYWRDALHYGEIRSGTRLELAQLGAALLSKAPNLDSVVFRGPGGAYSANSGFDTAHKGFITVQDIANALAHQASGHAVQSALAKAYALRPGETPTDPVYGEDFGHGGGGAASPVAGTSLMRGLAVVAALGLVGTLGYAAYREYVG